MRVSDLKLRLCLVGFLTLFALACGGPAGNESSPNASGDGPPGLTEDMIRERLNGSWINDVPERDGAGEPITWRFFESEPKEIVIVDKQVNGTSATVVLDIRTTSSPRSREKRYLEGKLRVDWELRRGLVLRQWEVVGTENISLKYKNLPNVETIK